MSVRKMFNRFNVFEKKPSLDSYRNVVMQKAIGLLEQAGYRKISPLGKGVFGDVVVAKCPDKEMKVAIKMIPSDNTWTYEKSLWPSFQHENVLPLLKTMRIKWFDFFEMPLHPNSMDGFLQKVSFKKDPSSVRKCLNWTKDVLSGLGYLHERQICHMDVKVDNVLISSDMSAILCDFSCVNTTTEPVDRYGLLQKYRPPECWYSSGEKRPAVHGVPFDSWSVGILLLSSLTGKWMDKKIKQFEIWKEDVLPCMQKALELPKFRSLMKKTFPAAPIEKTLVRDILNFLQGTLTKKTEHRLFVSTLLDHRIFRESGIFFLPDKMWIAEMQEEIEQNDENIEEAGDHKSAFVHKDNDDEEKNDLVSNHKESMDEGECSNKIEEKPLEDDMDPFEFFVYARAHISSSAASNKLQDFAAGGDYHAGEKWTACFEELKELPKEKKATMAKRMKGWFRKKTGKEKNLD